MAEKKRHERAFESYYALGSTRSLSKLAKSLGVAHSTVKLWSRRYGWQHRVAERDAEVAEIVKARTLDDDVDHKVRNQRLVRAAILATAKQIAEGKIRASFSDLDKLMRLEAFLKDEAESRQEVITANATHLEVDRLSKLPLPELKARARKLVKNLQRALDESGPEEDEGGEEADSPLPPPSPGISPH